MRRLLQSRWLGQQGALIVLLLLCAYYSYETWDVHHPATPQAGRALARRIVQQHGDEARVLVINKDTQRDRAFAEALEEEFTQRGATVIENVAAEGPIDARQALQRAAEQHETVHAIATNHGLSQWGPLQADKIEQMADEYPALAETVVHQPASYMWPSFLTWANLQNVLKNNAEIAIIAIGMTMVIITAGIDLCVGSLLALCGVITAVVAQRWAGGAEATTIGLTAAALAGVAVCAMCGAFNGTMVTVFNVPAFIVTLAMMMIARGLALKVAVNYQKEIAGGAAEGTPELVRMDAESFGWLANESTWGIPHPIIVAAFLYLIAHVVMTRTSFGRHVYAVGGNKEAARLSGVPVRMVLIFVYTICGVMAGISGLLDTSRFEGGRPNAGELYELQVIAAVVVGGTSLVGGEGTILGTLVGALIIAVIKNGLNMAGVQSFDQGIVFGLLILVAVLLDVIRKGTWRLGGG